MIEALSVADSSVGWAAMIGSGTAPVFGFLPRSSFDVIYGDGPDVIGGGALAPKGFAEQVDGGYRVTGRWPLVSGCQHADWLALHAIVTSRGAPVLTPAGGPMLRVCVFRACDVDIIDTWRVSGLRGTGSHDVTVEDAFCADAWTCAMFGAKPSVAAGGIMRIPILAQLGLFISAVAVGIAQGAIDDVAALATAGKQPAFGGGRRLAESSVFQDRLGEADAQVRAARSLLYAVCAEADATADRDQAFTVLDRARLRSTAPQVVSLATAATDTAYSLGGGTAVYDASPLQRRLRDIHALTQHAAVGRDDGAPLSGPAVMGVLAG